MKIIKTAEAHHAALAELEKLMRKNPAPGSAAADRLELLALLVEDYEKKHFPIPSPDPVEAILFRMEQDGLTRADLVPFIGPKSKVSEVLGKKRPLSLSMIRKLHRGLGIPAEILLAEAVTPA
jgi:HTH-type transcriptional regulator/antitoxin HigA